MKYGKAWLIWVFGTIGYFAVYEYMAIADGIPGGTLSEWVWHLLQFPAFSVPFTIVYFGGIIWLTVHFFKKAKW